VAHGSCILGHGSLSVWVTGSWVTAGDPLPALHMRLKIGSFIANLPAFWGPARANFEILTGGTFKGVKLCRSVKFRRNLSNRGQNVAISRFSKMAAATTLDFQNFKFLSAGQLKRVKTRRRAKFG